MLIGPCVREQNVTQAFRSENTAEMNLIRTNCTVTFLIWEFSVNHQFFDSYDQSSWSYFTQLTYRSYKNMDFFCIFFYYITVKLELFHII